MHDGPVQSCGRSTARYLTSTYTAKYHVTGYRLLDTDN
jgi:hypothetical protein